VTKSYVSFVTIKYT